MTAVTVISAKGSPGVTTSALLLAALLPGSLLVEADPAGGDLRSRLSAAYGLPLRADLGVVSLLAAHRTATGPADRTLPAHTQQLPGGLEVLVGPGSPAQAEALAPVWPQLAVATAAHRGLVLVDAGRLSDTRSTTWQLLDHSLLTLVVTGPSLTQVAHTRNLLSQLQQATADPATHAGSPPAFVKRAGVGVLVIGEPTDQQQALDALQHTGSMDFSGRLPHDPGAANQLLTGSWNRRLDRSPLLAAGRRLALELYEHLQVFTTVPGDPQPSVTSSGEVAAEAVSVPYPTAPATEQVRS